MNAKQRKHGTEGFTLLELILVMLILSTVLAMAGPSLRGFFASRKAHDTAAQILAITQYARSQAISEGITYRLNFDVSERTYWLTSWQSGTFKELKTGLGRTFTLPKDIEMDLENVEEDQGKIFLKFTPRGIVTAGTVRLSDQSGRTVEVTAPTMTEPFYIVEGAEERQSYARYTTRQTG